MILDVRADDGEHAQTAVEVEYERARTRTFARNGPVDFPVGVRLTDHDTSRTLHHDARAAGVGIVAFGVGKEQRAARGRSRE